VFFLEGYLITNSGLTHKIA